VKCNATPAEKKQFPNKKPSVRYHTKRGCLIATTTYLYRSANADILKQMVNVKVTSASPLSIEGELASSKTE